MKKFKAIVFSAACAAVGAVTLSDGINSYASPRNESSYQPPESWEETQARVKVLVSEGYNVCATFHPDSNKDLGLILKDHCFRFDEADELRHSGVSPKEANPLTDYHSDWILKLRESGCSLIQFPNLLKQSKQAVGATENTYEAMYLAETACLGKRKIQDLYKYGPRFRGQDYRGTPLIKRLDEVGITTPQEAECFSLALSGEDVVRFGEDKINCRQERAYAGLVDKRKLRLLYHQRENDCSDVLGAIKQGISPKTAEWYFQLGDQNPELDIDICDMATLEKKVAAGRTTRKEIKAFASEENERLRRERAKEALR